MTQNTTSVRHQNRPNYSEHEAAAALGMSVDDLRMLIRHRVVKNEEDLPAGAVTSFSASDLLMLRVLSQTCGVAF